MTKTITRETATAEIIDELTALNLAYPLSGPDKYNDLAVVNKERADAVKEFIQDYPTIGDAVDAYQESRARLVRALPKFAMYHLGTLLETQPELAKPLSAESSVRELVCAYRNTPKPEEENLADARVRNRLRHFEEYATSDFSGVFGGVVKDIKGQPYANIGEIVKDSKNGKKMLGGALGLGPKGGELLFDFARQAVAKDLGQKEEPSLPGF